MDKLYWIALVLAGLFLILLFLARKEEAAKDTASLLKPFYRMAMYLYKKSCLWFPKVFSSAQVEKDLLQLYPGEPGEYLKTSYYVKKAALCFAVAAVGTFMGAAAKFAAENQIILGEDGTIARNGYQEGSREIHIVADYEQSRMDFRIEVEPLLLAGEEAEEIVDTFIQGLPGMILAKNESLEKVSSDLFLAEEYGNFPVKVEWESSVPGVLNSEGQVFSPEENTQVELKACISYGACERTALLQVTVTPPEIAEEELLYREMEEMLLLSQSESVLAETWKLPVEWRGSGIGWQQRVEDNSLILWAAGMAAAVMVFLLLDRDLHEQLEKRRRSLHREYSEIVHKLALFVGAGMTIRGAFQKIAGDYEAKCRSGGKKSPAYEEVLYTCRELRSGISEALSYEHFGRRTGLQEYIRLSALLTQNLKRGSSTLLERLRDEADKSAEERLQQSKKLGEEAGTKLLIPMVLMLAVVMAVIMIPALSNM